MPGTDGFLGETSTVVCVMCVTDSEEAVADSVCHPQALECLQFFSTCLLE